MFSLFRVRLAELSRQGAVGSFFLKLVSSLGSPWTRPRTPWPPAPTPAFTRLSAHHRTRVQGAQWWGCWFQSERGKHSCVPYRIKEHQPEYKPSTLHYTVVRRIPDFTHTLSQHHHIHTIHQCRVSKVHMNTEKQHTNAQNHHSHRQSLLSPTKTEP